MFKLGTIFLIVLTWAIVWAIERFLGRYMTRTWFLGIGLYCLVAPITIGILQSEIPSWVVQGSNSLGIVFVATSVWVVNRRGERSGPADAAETNVSQK